MGRLTDSRAETTVIGPSEEPEDGGRTRQVAGTSRKRKDPLTATDVSKDTLPAEGESWSLRRSSNERNTGRGARPWCQSGAPT